MKLGKNERKTTFLLITIPILHVCQSRQDISKEVIENVTYNQRTQDIG